MKFILRALKPIPLGIIFVLLALAAQFVFCSSHTSVSSGNFSSETYYASYGLGSPIRITTSGGKTDMDILWPLLVANLFATYAFSNLVARELLKLVRLRRPAISYGLVIASMVGLTFLISICISKAYWGYFFSPPPLPAETDDLTELRTIINFRTQTGTTGKPEFVPDSDYSLAAHLESAHKYRDSRFEGSILLALEEKHLLQREYVSSLTNLSELYQLIEKTGVLVPSSKGYDSSIQLSGLLVQGIDKQGNDLLILGFNGGQVSNDHYPYYDMVFRAPAGSSHYSLVRAQHYYYDAAGLEGFEWPVIWMLISIPGIVLGIVIFSVLRAVLPWSRTAYAAASPDLDSRG